MKDIYDRIEEIRIELGLSYKDIGEVIGIGADATRKAIVIRKNLKPNYINTFSDKYRINKEYLETGQGTKYNKQESNTVQSAFNSEDVHKYIFDKQTIEGKLSMIFETTVKNNEVLTAKIQDLEDQLRVSQLLNRTYLRSLIVSNKIKKEDIDSAQDLEINIDQKKQSSN